MNWRFQAKRVKNSNFHIENFKNPTWRRPPSWKNEKSRYLRNGLTDFDEILHGVASRCSRARRLVTGCRGWRCTVMQNFVKIRQSVVEILQFFIFSRWRPSAILDLCGAKLDHPRSVLGGLYQFAKFGCRRCSTFENMTVWIFHAFGLKTPIHARKIRVLGEFDPLNGQKCQRIPKKAHPYASPRRLSHQARKSTDPSDLYVSSQKRGYK